MTGIDFLAKLETENPEQARAFELEQVLALMREAMQRGPLPA